MDWHRFFNLFSTYFLFNFVIFYVLFSIGLSRSHDLSCGFDRLTRVSLLLILWVTCLSCQLGLIQTSSFVLFITLFIRFVFNGLRIKLHCLSSFTNFFYQVIVINFVLLIWCVYFHYIKFFYHILIIFLSCD